ncbi:integrase core domain-containing protein [uncultured Desulfovibrio sp.]|uniref:integrase core domain-containing protein n=1 Tax=uncultured Desulfovibrio sp. TaxID=167968 RepID=UPI0034467510
MDNGTCYASRKFREACREFGIQYKRTRPYRPQTNVKVERFSQTALKEWAYAQTTPTHGKGQPTCLDVSL